MGSCQSTKRIHNPTRAGRNVAQEEISRDLSIQRDRKLASKRDGASMASKRSQTNLDLALKSPTRRSNPSSATKTLVNPQVVYIVQANTITHKVPTLLSPEKDSTIFSRRVRADPSSRRARTQNHSQSQITYLKEYLRHQPNKKDESSD